MIAKSDLIILVVSAGALAVGVYRWQQNLTQPPLATTTVRVVAGTPPAPSAPAEDPVAARPGDATTSPGIDVRPRVRRLSANGADEPGSADTTALDQAANGGAAPGADSSAGDGTPQTTADIAAGGGGEALYGIYRVSEGDYLGLIAERFGTSVRTLRSINDIEGSKILVGQEIRYPLPAN